jgi:hypothetical protein
VHSPNTTGGDPPAHVQTRVAERFDLGQARAIPLALQQFKQANVPHVSIEVIRPGRSPPVARWWGPADDDFPFGDEDEVTRLTIEVVRRVVRQLIDERGHHRITIDPAADNAAAIRAYEKVGFGPVGVMRRYERDVDGPGWHDGPLMELLA